MTNVDFEDGVMTVNVEFENDFHKVMHDEVCGVFGKINNEWKEVLKANGVTREKIEEMAKESIKELEKDCPDIWDKIIQGYIEAISGKKEQKYEPKDGDFIFVKSRLKPYVTKYSYIGIFHDIIKDDGCSPILLMYASLKDDNRIVCGNSIEPYNNAEYIRPATEEEKKLLIDQLAKKNKRWNKWTKSIEYIEYIPQDGDIVTMPMIPDLANFLKAKKYIAIYKREDIEEEKIYCYFIIGQHRNGDTFVFKEDHITDNGTMISEIKLATKEEKNLLFDKLAESGKRWNEETKTIEDVRWRAGKGKPYYYITGLDNIVGTTDERLACDENRYATNNYFKTREAAEKVAEQIGEIFKNSKVE